MTREDAGLYLRKKLRFDTLDKKPNLYLMAVLFAAVFVVSLLLPLYFDRDRAGRLTILMYGIFFILAFFLLVRAFFGQLRYNPYSYNTIYYSGFSLFLVFVIITHAYLALRILREPAGVGTRDMIWTLLYSARNYLVLMSPFLFVFAAGLFVSNISLIRHEGGGFVNFLGMILAFLILAAESVLIYSGGAAYGSAAMRAGAFPAGPGASARREFLLNLFTAFFLYFECMLVGAILADVIAAVYEPAPDKDYLIVPGCGLKKDGTPTPLLKGRLDRAVEFYRMQCEAGGKMPVFVVSGGQGDNEVMAESESMARYLADRGIPPSQIRQESLSRSTFENMKFSRDIIRAEDPGAKVAFSTTNYHVFRAGLKARRVKMRAQGMGAPTKWYFWPNASVREFAGLLTEHRGKQALILGGVLASHVMLTYLLQHMAVM